MDLNRRELLRLLGAGGSGAALGTLGAHSLLSVPDHVFERVLTGPRVETWVNSTCSQCAGGCGIRVRLIDGIPVRIQGNPLHPVNRGSVCARAEAGIEALFSPNRIKQPLARSGPRGDADGWGPLSWEEALSRVVQRLRALEENGQRQRLVIWADHPNEMLTHFARRFAAAYGTPNFYCFGAADLLSLPVRMTQGLSQVPVYDFERTQYVLNFGADFLDSEPNPIRFNRLYAEARSREGNAPARIVHCSAYQSRTAAKSSEWLPVKPGLSGLVALSFAHVMLRDGSYDRSFVEHLSTGFEGDVGFRSLVMQRYYPQRVAELTGLSAAKLVRVAREFAAATSGFAVAGPEPAESANAFFNMWAIHCLNALKGSIGSRGGLLFFEQPPENAQRPVAPGSTASLDDGNGRYSFPAPSADRVLRSCLRQDPYPVDTLLTLRTDPIRTAADKVNARSALEKIPFIVHFSSILDEGSAYADLILPEPTFLERFDGCLQVPACEFHNFGIQQPVLDPLYDSRHPADVLLQIARELGGQTEEGLAEDSFLDYLQNTSRELFESAEGSVLSERVDREWLEFLRERGFQPGGYSNFEEFWTLLLEKGGWWNPFPKPLAQNQLFVGPTAKFDFLPTELAELGLTADAPGYDLDPPARWEVPKGLQPQAEFPYQVVHFQLLATIGGRTPEVPLLREMAGVHSREYTGTWIEISPHLASRENIREGDRIAILSRRVALAGPARINPTLMPDLVAVPRGVNGEDRDRYGLGATVLGGLDDHEWDELTGLPGHQPHRVRIVKVTEQT